MILLGNIMFSRLAAIYRGGFEEMGLDSVKQLEIVMKKSKSHYGIKSLF